MSVESHLRESMLKTALNHLLRNQQKSPDRTARNIQEVLARFSQADKNMLLDYEELLQIIKSFSREDCVDWIMKQIHLS